MTSHNMQLSNNNASQNNIPGNMVVAQFEFVIPSAARNLVGFLVADAPRNDKLSHYRKYP